jgi:hypothetical protein
MGKSLWSPARPLPNAEHVAMSAAATLHARIKNGHRSPQIKSRHFDIRGD